LPRGGKRLTESESSTATDGYVFDASALLALLHRERGVEAAEAALEGAAMSTVNWVEVHQRSLARRVDVTGLRTELQALGLELVPLSVDDAEHAAELRERTRHLGLSLADRACLALASRLDRTVLTTDRAWLDLDLGIHVQAIR
jgi:ribonuclease VapC